MADDEEVINYMITLSDSIELTRKERWCGWYHSHPFDVAVQPSYVSPPPLPHRKRERARGQRGAKGEKITPNTDCVLFRLTTNPICLPPPFISRITLSRPPSFPQFFLPPCTPPARPPLNPVPSPNLNKRYFLSATDVGTQLTWQRGEDPFGNPWLSVVVDPLRSLAKVHDDNDNPQYK